MTKKIIIVLLAVILTLGLVACKEEEEVAPEYDLTFVGMDGEVVTEIKVSGNAIQLPKGPEIQGYNFKGWYLGSPDSDKKLNANHFITNPATSDMTAYACYDKVEYKLTLMLDDKVYGKTITIKDEEITLPTPKESEIGGRDFYGWYLESGEQITEDYFVKNPSTKDLVAYAKYGYTLIFEVDGKVLTTYRNITNERIKLPKAPIKTGYAFYGWSIMDDDIKLEEDYLVSSPAKHTIVATASYYRFDVVPSSLTGCTVEKFNVIGEVYEVEVPESFDLRIEDEVITYSVEMIHGEAFRNCQFIREIQLPDTVDKIGNRAFANCVNLEKINVPAIATADKVGTEIFYNTPELKYIEAPTWVVAQANCRKLVRVTFNAGTEIYDRMFQGANKLLSVELPDDLKRIGNQAFDGASVLKEIHIPAGIENISEDAFTYCTSLEVITIDGHNDKYVSNGSNCIVLVEEDEVHGTIETLIIGCSKTTIYKGIERIGQYAFIGCSRLTHLNIPSTVTDIAEGAFYGCTAMSSITVHEDNPKYKSVNNCLIIPNTKRLVQGCKSSVIDESMGIITISADAFAGCIGLTEIYIPTTVKSLAADSFNGCTGLITVVIGIDSNGNHVVFDEKVDVFSNCNSFKNITVPMQWLNCFISKARTQLVNVTVTTGTEIADNCFVGCSNLSYVTLPDGIARIGDSAFQGCAKLNNVKITSTSALTSIGHNAFDGCKAFTAIVVNKEGTLTNTDKLVIPAIVDYIGDYAFRNTAIAGLELADGYTLRVIGYKVFANCANLNTIIIPSDIATVDFYAFDGCENIKVATLPARFIRAIYETSDGKREWAMKTLTVTEGVIDCNYIRNMINLETLNIGKDVTYIDNKVFEVYSSFKNSISSLKNITVDAENAKYKSVSNCIIEKETQTLILGRATEETGGVKKVVIPADVKVIKAYAFAHSAIQEVSVPAGVKVEEFAFSYCIYLEKITIDGDGKIDDALAIDVMAFDGCDKVKTISVPANTLAGISKASLVNVTVTCGEIPADAFKDCVTLKTVTITSDVKVGANAFAGCNNVTDVSAPASGLAAFSTLNDQIRNLVINKLDADITREIISNIKNMETLKIVVSSDDESQYIKSGAFLDCKSLKTAEVPAWALVNMYTDSIETLVINAGTTVSGDFRFPALKSVTFAATINSIDAVVFSQSKNLNAIVANGNATYSVVDNCMLEGTKIVLAANGATIPNTATEIGDYAFASRANLNITFPEGLQTVGANAFAGCTSLTTIYLPGVKTIGANAFAGCTNVTTINLPLVETIGDGAFSGCTSATSASVPVLAITSMPKSLTSLTVVAGDELAMNSIVGFNNLENLTIGATVEKIDPRMIGRNTLKSVKVDAGNTKYYSKDNAYVITNDTNTLVFGCNINRVVIPEGVVAIGEYAFNGCTAITSVKFSSTVSDIHHFAFNGCTSIDTLTVASGNVTYYEYSDNNCIIQRVDADTFTLIMGCKESIIPSFVNVIGDYAFYGVTGLTKVDIPATVTTIGKYAFANTAIVEIRLYNAATSIGNNAFEGCAKLNKVIFLDDGQLKSIGDEAFKNCAELQIVVLPKTIESVGVNVFADSPLAEVYFGGTAEEFEALADEVKAALDGVTVYYYSATYVPGCWYYKDGGINVDLWA